MNVLMYILKTNMLGKIIKQLRQEKQLSHDKLAELSGVQRLTIIKTEQCRNDLQFSNVVKLLKVLLPRHKNGRFDYTILHKIFD